MYSTSVIKNTTTSTNTSFVFTEVDTISGFSITQESDAVVTFEGGFTKTNFMLLNMPTNSDPIVSYSL
jgi:hypothetical protein